MHPFLGNRKNPFPTFQTFPVLSRDSASSKPFNPHDRLQRPECDLAFWCLESVKTLERSNCGCCCIRVTCFINSARLKRPMLRILSPPIPFGIWIVSWSLQCIPLAFLLPQKNDQNMLSILFAISAGILKIAKWCRKEAAMMELIKISFTDWDKDRVLHCNIFLEMISSKGVKWCILLVSWISTPR